MSKLKITGKQTFMGVEIPVILGGFGENKRCMSDKSIAQIHGMNTFNVRKRITDNINRFKESIDIIDVKQRIHEINTLEFLQKLGYAKQSITQAEHIYILSERGYSKLIKIMDTDLAWEVHDKIMDEYFKLREEAKLPTGNKLLALAVLEANQLLQEKDEEIQRMRPKVVFAEAVTISDDCISIGELAKLIKQNGVDIGQNRLFKWMRDNGYLISRVGDDYNLPTQRAMDLKVFAIQESTRIRSDGTIKIEKTTKVTGKGQIYFVRKFLSQIKQLKLNA